MNALFEDYVDFRSCGPQLFNHKVKLPIVWDLIGEGEASLIYNLDKTTRKVRKTIEAVGSGFVIALCRKTSVLLSLHSWSQAERALFHYDNEFLQNRDPELSHVRSM